MAQAVIGALRVNLGLNSASFRSGLDSSRISVAGFAKAAAAAFAGLAAAAAGAFAKVQQAALDADGMIKASRSVGVQVQELSKLRHGAEMSGSSFEDLQRVILAMSKSVGQSLQGMNNEATNAFKVLNIPLRDAGGTARKTSEILKDVADRFSKMPDGVTKTALAVAALGRRGTDLISFLNNGRDGIEAMGREAENLGLVFNQKTGVAAELFNDNLARLSKTMTGFWNRVLANVIPAMADFTSRIVAATTQGGRFDTAVNGISRALSFLVNGLGFAFDHLGDLYDLFKVFVAAKIITYIAALSGAFLTMARTARTAGITLALVTKITRAKITVILLLAAAVAKLTGTYDDLVGWVEDLGSKIMESLPESVRNGIEDVTGAITGMGDEIRSTDEAAGRSLETYLRFGDAAADSFGNVSLRVRDVDNNLKDSKKSSEELGTTAHDTFSQVGSGIRDLIKGTSDWNDVLANVLQNIGNILIQQSGIFKTGSSGGFGAIGSIATGLLGGLLGFRDGGSFKVGGNGLADSQIVAFKASPNETVSVGSGAEVSGGGVGKIYVQVNVEGARGSAEIEEAANRGALRGASLAVETVKRNFKEIATEAGQSKG